MVFWRLSGFTICVKYQQHSVKMGVLSPLRELSQPPSSHTVDVRPSVEYIMHVIACTQIWAWWWDGKLVRWAEAEGILKLSQAVCSALNRTVMLRIELKSLQRLSGGTIGIYVLIYLSDMFDHCVAILLCIVLIGLGFGYLLLKQVNRCF
jgi:hypothetical protein